MTIARPQGMPSSVGLGAAFLLAAILPALVAVTAGPMSVLVLVTGAAGVAGIAAATRYDTGPVFLVLAVCAAGALVLLPSVRGEAGRREEYEFYGLVTGVAVAASVAMVLLRPGQPLELVNRRSAILDVTVLCYVALGAGATAIGFASGNPASYVAGDTYRILLLPALYYVTALSVRSFGAYRTVVIGAAILLTLQQSRDLVSAVQVLGSGDTGRIDPVLWIQNVGGLIAALTVAATVRSRAGRVAACLCAVVIVVTGMTGGFRTYVLLLVILALLPFAVRPFGAIRSTPRVFTAFAIAAIPCIMLFSVVAPLRAAISTSLNTIETRIQRTTQGSDLSIDGRTLEADVVRSRLAGEPGRYISGFGAGAVYDLPSNASPYALALYAPADYKVHNIHNSYAAMAFRHGLGGVALLAGTFVVAIIQSYRVIGRFRTPIAWFPFATIIAFALASPFFFFVPGDTLFAIVLGLTAAVLRLPGSGSEESHIPA